jgi:menaquinone-dependent protoporphyrinogen oxidase
MAEKTVLIAYSSKYGSTEEIAHRIGETLTEKGFTVTVQRTKKAKDLSDFGAVILGSGAYMGRWRREAAAFLKKKERALAEKRTWIFSSGPTGTEKPNAFMNGKSLPDSLQAIADRIRPVNVTVFHGKVVADKLNFFEKKVMKMVKAPSGDFRVWKDITAWAEGIAEVLKKS